MKNIVLPVSGNLRSQNKEQSKKIQNTENGTAQLQEKDCVETKSEEQVCHEHETAIKTVSIKSV